MGMSCWCILLVETRIALSVMNFSVRFSVHTGKLVISVGFLQHRANLVSSSVYEHSYMNIGHKWIRKLVGASWKVENMFTLGVVLMDHNSTKSMCFVCLSAFFMESTYSTSYIQWTTTSSIVNKYSNLSWC